jgi:hypothetical protein
LVQLIGQRARGKLKEASERALGTRELPREDLITIEVRPSRTNAAGPLWTNLATASE